MSFSSRLMGHWQVDLELVSLYGFGLQDRTDIVHFHFFWPVLFYHILYSDLAALLMAYMQLCIKTQTVR
jgi:hypothetical protein